VSQLVDRDPLFAVAAPRNLLSQLGPDVLQRQHQNRPVVLSSTAD
jgi:hypothetical protein